MSRCIFYTRMYINGFIILSYYGLLARIYIWSSIFLALGNTIYISISDIAVLYPSLDGVLWPIFPLDHTTHWYISIRSWISIVHSYGLQPIGIRSRGIDLNVFSRPHGNVTNNSSSKLFCYAGSLLKDLMSDWSIRRSCYWDSKLRQSPFFRLIFLFY